MHKSWGASLCSLEHSYAHIIISFWCILWILNIVWISSFVRNWICAFDSTHNMRNAQIKEELILYWSSRFFSPFWHLLPMGEKFRGFRWSRLVHAYLHLLWLLHGCVYRGNSTKFFHAYIVGEFALYSVVLLASNSCVVFRC